VTQPPLTRAAEASPAQPDSLRERKKAKTRAALRQHALRLFREQGYHATTVEQIAEAAEVSPSTFFRYFPTKEDVVLRDDMELIAIPKFEAQPPELTPIAALRAAIRETFAETPPDQTADLLELFRMTLHVPELRSRFLDETTQSMETIATLIARRASRDPADFAVRTLAGGLIGVSLAVMMMVAENPAADMLAMFDAGLARLEEGLPL